jgi:hypothetical protein
MIWREAKPAQGEPVLPKLPVESVGAEPLPPQTIVGLLVLLFFKPAKFFCYIRSLKGRGTHFFLALSYGLAMAIDGAFYRAGPAAKGTWGEFWASTALAGAVGCLLILFIGEWWFTLRLRWSGERNRDRTLVRKVFLCAAQVMALPVIAKTLVGTLLYPDPAAQAAAERPGVLLVFGLLPVWLFVVEYIGVRSVFHVGKWRARIWYLALPAILYLLILIPFVRWPVPDLVRPASFSSRTMAFSYPGNWNIDKKEFPFDPERSVWVVSARGSVTGILFYESQLGPEAGLKFGFDNLVSLYGRTADLPPFDTWGSYRGHGMAFSGRAEKSEVTVRVFAARISETTILEVREVLVAMRPDPEKSGHELIRKTFKLTGK